MVAVPKIFLGKLRPDLAAKGLYAITSDVGREVDEVFFSHDYFTSKKVISQML